ncbi:hypothetical protein [Lichenifustis flavocetrariae]|uniref:Uncharacterized protein n=1 Tax=Lichenifustis flavocetrariae TaxID=2949735 RepID=A0AA41YXM6_9HYPH|nr:hypothetical protein [Lichenifustis flavocetrariae]MCW6506730.1 hypothetical protein [Lichenifustis flavocetrariae]
MANLLPATSTKGYGFDAINSAVAMQTGEKYDMWLFGGEDIGLDITQGKDVVALESVDMSRSNPRTFSLRGLKEGSATLVGRLTQDVGGWKSGAEFIQPLTIRVGPAKAGHAQVRGKVSVDGKGSIVVHPGFRDELRALKDWRKAVIRVAEDQMNSEIGSTQNGGDGIYDDKDIMWCGSFVSFLYATIAGVDSTWANSLGAGLGVNSPLRSGIKALSHAMQNPGRFTVLNYAGDDQFAGAPPIKVERLVGSGVELQQGDICLPRDQYGVFRHVCILYKPPTGNTDFICIDGNTFGNYVPSGLRRGNNGCIAYSSHDQANQQYTIQAKTYKTKSGEEKNVRLSMGSKFRHYVFIHIDKLS